MEINVVKKKLLFLIPMLLVVVALFLLRATGMTAHIAVSVVGLVLLIAYTVATKKEWKNPALEILQRVCYGIALITGVVLMNVHGIAAVSIIHKISAVLFVILLADVEIHKAIKK
jgi:Na+/H+ antiporter NhaD/arsenite permease-like protein